MKINKDLRITKNLDVSKQVQQAIGNKFPRLLPRSKINFANISINNIQAKLKISQPNDVYEKEADSVAEQVMRISPKLFPLTNADEKVQGRCGSCKEDEEKTKRKASLLSESTPEQNETLQRKCTCGTASGMAGECEECHKKRGVLQRRSVSQTENIEAPSIVHEVLRSPGQPLDTETRAFMEQRFGYDFRSVRVHTSTQAAESARQLQALAFTVKDHIVFAEGRYVPRTTEGQRLLAHELSHTLQQGNVGTAFGVIMRKWDKATSECSGAPADKWIQRITVQQETPQTVTVHWSDGSSDSDSCSTGKGHCCVDPSVSTGVACTLAGSRVEGSNCTPITRAKGYPVQNRVVDHNGVPLWTEFVPERGIALHQYKPVDGTPLSHGCVRLNEGMARKIFCGVRQNQTWVQVQGFPRPMCNHPNLQREWERDFATGGADISKADGDTQASIRETRRMLNAAFGRVLNVEEIRTLTAKDIPRCSATAPLPTP